MFGDPLDDAPNRRLMPVPDRRRARSSVLIVEPNHRVGRKLREVAITVAATTLCPDFDGGRAEMQQHPPGVLVTNLRLEAYNGLHLVLLSQATSTGARCLVHTDRPDFLLVGEALGMGAFFERTERLPYSLVAFITGDLPPADRRNPDQFDRRSNFRGGRRASDIEGVAKL